MSIAHTRRLPPAPWAAAREKTDVELKDLLTRDRDKWRVTKQQPDGSWIAFVPRYPDLIGCGATFTAAGKHLLQLQKEYLEGHAQ